MESAYRALAVPSGAARITQLRPFSDIGRLRPTSGAGRKPDRPLLNLESRKRTSSSIIWTARFDPKLTRDPRRCTPRERSPRPQAHTQKKEPAYLSGLATSCAF